LSPNASRNAEIGSFPKLVNDEIGEPVHPAAATGAERGRHQDANGAVRIALHALCLFPLRSA
jgi:hypothetical protein